MDVITLDQNPCFPSGRGVFKFGIFLIVTLYECKGMFVSETFTCSSNSFFHVFYPFSISVVFFPFSYFTPTSFCFFRIWLLICLCVIFINFWVGTFILFFLDVIFRLYLLIFFFLSQLSVFVFLGSFHFIRFFGIFSSLAVSFCYSSFFICPSIPISHPGFLLLLRLFNGIPIYGTN